MSIKCIVWSPLTKTQVVQDWNHIRVNKWQIFNDWVNYKLFSLKRTDKEKNAEQLQDPNTGET